MEILAAPSQGYLIEVCVLPGVSKNWDTFHCFLMQRNHIVSELPNDDLTDLWDKSHLKAKLERNVALISCLVLQCEGQIECWSEGLPEI